MRYKSIHSHQNKRHYGIPVTPVKIHLLEGGSNKVPTDDMMFLSIQRKVDK